MADVVRRAMVAANGKMNGSLALVEQLAALQRVVKPALDQVMIRIFAGDHGVAFAQAGWAVGLGP